MARFAAVFDEEPPFEHDVLGDREHALLEHRPYPMREPVVEFGAATGVGNEFNAEANFSEGHRADMEKFERLGGYECENFAFRLGAAQLGENVGVEKPAGQNRTSGPGRAVRVGSGGVTGAAEG